MKKFLYRLDAIGNLRCLLLPVLASVLLLHARISGQNVVLGLERAQIPGEIDYTALVRWLAMMTLPLLINGFYISRCRRIELFSILRFRKRESWLTQMMLGCILITVCYTVLLVLPLLYNQPVQTILPAWLLLTLNMLLWTELLLLLNIVFPKASWTGIMCAAIICAVHVVGEQFPIISQWLPTTWGMYCRTDRELANGASVLFCAVANMGTIGIVGAIGAAALRYVKRRDYE